MATRKALFLDRDGIINVNHGYVGDYENFDYIDGVFALIDTFVKAGYQVVIVTNQSGIARGYYTQENFLALMERVQRDFSAAGLPTIPVYYCPHHPQSKLVEYKKACRCRKPQPGMLLRAQQELGIDLSRSVLVGDSWSDIEAALAAELAHSFYVCEKYMPENAPEGKVTRVNHVADVCAQAQQLGLI
jgi:D-glycero-D-manno-heptose 1,7-bisphosphate phosphatase